MISKEGYNPEELHTCPQEGLFVFSFFMYGSVTLCSYFDAILNHFYSLVIITFFKDFHLCPFRKTN